MAWLERIFSEDEPVGIPWQSITAFLRVMTYPSLTLPRFTIPQALGIVNQWLALPHVRALAQGALYSKLLAEMMLSGEARGQLVSNAAQAALTIEHGGALYSAGRDFARFPGLRWCNPLRQS